MVVCSYIPLEGPNKLQACSSFELKCSLHLKEVGGGEEEKQNHARSRRALEMGEECVDVEVGVVGCGAKSNLSVQTKSF